MDVGMAWEYGNRTGFLGDLAEPSGLRVTDWVAPTGYDRLWHVQVRGILRADEVLGRPNERQQVGLCGCEESRGNVGNRAEFFRAGSGPRW